MYKLHKDRHDQIKACLELDVDGIEVLFPTIRSMIGFKFTGSEIKKLRKFKFNTIHFPFWDKRERQTAYLRNKGYYRKAIEKVFHLAEQINAVNINLHAHQLKNPKLFDGFDKNRLSFENLEEKQNFEIKDYKIVIEKYPEFKMLLDISHGIRTKQLETLLKNFKDKIKLIHLSIAKGPGNGNDHFMLHRFDQIKVRRLDIIKKLDCPVIIEAGREKGLTMDDFRKEIKYVRKWLNS
jgi:hypothetical protein